MMICYKMLTVLVTLLLYFELSLSSEWSECSRSCGTGITYRTVSCHSQLVDHCTGTKKEYQVCNTMECPDSSTDFRASQCQEVEVHSVSFSNMDNPCKLMCALPGEVPVEKGTVVDGTPCGASGVCVAGTCIPRGCDGLLGSDKKMDKCERCGATEGVCLHVPCNVKKINGQEKAHLVKLPAESAHLRLRLKSSACDIQAISENTTIYFNHTSAITISGSTFKHHGHLLTSLGPLHEEISIQIQHCQLDEIGCKYYVPIHEYTPVKFGAAHFDKHMWKVGENYTACSRTCGTGIKMSEIYCINIESKQRVNDTLCKDFTKTELKPRIRNCTMPECPYVWKQGDWTMCSKSCGGGKRTRSVACVQVTRSGVHVNPGACFGEKPRNTETCNSHYCYNHWYAGKYSECSNECGIGRRRREVICLNAHGKRTNDANCDLSMKPREVDECTGDMCIYRWARSTWTNCSEECGNGIQARTIECHRVADNRLVNEKFCIDNISTPKPKAQRSCRGCQCTGVWGYDDWGKCDIPGCSREGRQYRNIYCYHGEKLASDYPDIKCDMTDKPPTEQACNRTTGCYTEWVVHFGPCNKDCWSEGTLTCMQGNTIVVGDQLCPNHKPGILKKCNNHCEKCAPDGSCVEECNMEHPVCTTFPPNSNSTVIEDQLCKHNCCTCKKFTST